MKWFKTVFLTGIMTLVAWGVWRTLTDGPPASSDETERSSAPRFGASSVSGGSDASGQSVVVEMPENLGEMGSTHQGDIGAHHDGPASSDRSPLIRKDHLGRESSAPKFGANSSNVAVLSAEPGSKASDDSIASRRRQMEFDSMMQWAKERANQRDYVKAHEKLSLWYAQRDDLPEGRAAQMQYYLDRWGWKVVYSRDHTLLDPHTVGPNDSLKSVALTYSVPAELLAKINGVTDTNQLYTGQQLKVIPGPFHVEIQLSKLELTLLLGQKRLYACRFKIGVGSEVLLKEGEYVVVQKKTNPPYHFGRDTEVPGGNPINPLGRKLVEFRKVGNDDFAGALHGTSKPASVGRSCKEGCIRLTPEDIDHVYDMLSVGKLNSHGYRVGASRIIVRQ